jgi:polyhydroxybutyrate depolymerase
VPTGREPRVERTAYRQDGRAPVTLYTVVGGGHTVPGPARVPFVLGRTSHDLDAADLVAEHLGLRA